MANGTKLVWTLQEYIAHSGDVSCLALGQRSGRLLVTGGKDTKVNLWSLDKPNCLSSLSGHTTPVESVQFNHTDTVVAGGSSTGILKIWDLEASKLTHSFSNHKDAIRSIEFHVTGPFVATGSADHNVKLWDLRRKGCINTYKGHESAINSIRLSPDGRWLSTADDDGVVKLWRLDSGKEICEFSEHSASVSSIAFHPTDMILATGSSDRCVKFWDLDKQQLIGTTTPEGSRVRRIIFHPEGLCLYSVTSDCLDVYRWDPIHRSCTLPIQFDNVSDIRIVQDQLVGADFCKNKVSTFVVDITKIPPIGNDSLSPAVSGGRRTFNAESKPFDPASKPKKASSRSVDCNAADEDEETKGGGVDVKDPEFSEIIGKVKDFRPFVNPNEEVAATKKSENVRNPGPLNERSEQDAIQYLSQGHGNVMSVMANRHRNIRVVRSEWMSNSVKSAIDVAIGQRDQGTMVDLLHVLLCKLNLWNLDICHSMLPVLADLLHSKHEEYIHISLSTLRLIGQTFGNMIKSNVSSPPSVAQIDLARQDRYYKCLACYKDLMRIRSDLEGMKTNGRYNHGRLGDKIQEMYSLMTQIK